MILVCKNQTVQLYYNYYCPCGITVTSNDTYQHPTSVWYAFVPTTQAFPNYNSPFRLVIGGEVERYSETAAAFQTGVRYKGRRKTSEVRRHVATKLPER